MNRFLGLLFAFAVFLAAQGPRAQSTCQPVPGTGCPSSAPVQCSGSAQVGQMLLLTCLNQGRADQQLLSVGVCDPGGTPLPPPIVCTSQPCSLGVALGRAATINTRFQPTALFIPNDVGLIGQEFCAQCFGVVNSRPCLTMSQAVRFFIQP